jgi:hypothetical protein
MARFPHAKLPTWLPALAALLAAAALAGEPREVEAARPSSGNASAARGSTTASPRSSSARHRRRPRPSKRRASARSQKARRAHNLVRRGADDQYAPVGQQIGPLKKGHIRIISKRGQRPTEAHNMLSGGRPHVSSTAIIAAADVAAAKEAGHEAGLRKEAREYHRARLAAEANYTTQVVTVDAGRAPGAALDIIVFAKDEEYPWKIQARAKTLRSLQARAEKRGGNAPGRLQAAINDIQPPRGAR